MAIDRILSSHDKESTGQRTRLSVQRHLTFRPSLRTARTLRTWSRAIQFIRQENVREYGPGRNSNSRLF